MKIYMIANQKGGCGKTTTAVALASILQKKGFRSLLIDADQQGNSTDNYQAKFEGVATLYDIMLTPGEVKPIDAVQKTAAGDIIASDPLLREAEAKLSADPEGDFRLKDVVNDLDPYYDYVIIDTAPALNKVMRNCLVACHEVIIPVTADRFSMQGLSQLYETIEAIKKRMNPDLKIAGLLMVRHNDRTNLSKEAKETFGKHAAQMGTRLFSTFIRESTKAREAQAVRTQLMTYAPGSTTARDYWNFTEELLEGEG